MIALQKTKARHGVTLHEVAPPPPPGPGMVVIEVLAAGICGSDLHIDEWTPAYGFLGPALPVTLGHEFAGRIRETGPACDAWRPGDLVAVKPSIPCGQCGACQAGRSDDCTRRSALGLSRDGGFAPLVLSPVSQLLPLPQGVDPVLGALAEPLAVSGAAVAAGEVKPGDRVLVFGPGTIGQGAAMLARRAGADVVVVGKGDASRFATLNALGFDQLVDLDSAGAEDRLADLAGPGFDVVVEASGAAGAVRLGLLSSRLKGIFVAVGIHPAPVPIDLTLVARRQLQLRGSARGNHAVWLDVLAALSEAPDLFARMVTHRLPLGDALDGFALGHRRIASKVMLLPQAG